MSEIKNEHLPYPNRWTCQDTFLEIQKENKMKYQVDGWNNFCRVFEVPLEFPRDYCFGGGHPVNFQMVDWFNPVYGISQPAVSKDVWRKEVGKIEVVETTEDELRENLIPFLAEKQYVKPDRSYLVLCDFGAVIRFCKAEAQQQQTEAAEFKCDKKIDNNSPEQEVSYRLPQGGRYA